MDNAPCHHAVQAISENHVIRYLPAYSPFLTPVENAFSTWKWAIKNSLSDPAVQLNFTNSPDNNLSVGRWRRQLLIEHGEAAIPQITAQKCSNWQQHCTSYFPKCIEQEDILM